MKTHNKPLEYKIGSCADVSTRINMKAHHVSIFMTTNIHAEEREESRPHWNPNNNHFNPNLLNNKWTYCLGPSLWPPSQTRTSTLLSQTHIHSSFNTNWTSLLLISLLLFMNNTQSSVHLSWSICEDRQQDTLFLPKVVNDGVTETDYMRENSRLLTESLIPFPNRIVLIPDESHNYSAVNKNFLTVTGGTMGTGFLGSITLVYTVLSNSHLRPLRHTLTKF